MNNKTIIIGSSGFVGRTTYKLFKKKSLEVIGIDKVGPCDYTIDILKEFNKLEDIISSIKPTSVINLAALSNSKQCNNNKDLVYPLNVDFVDKALKLCIKNKVKNFIHSSSEWIYGKGPINVQTKLSPQECYKNNLDLYSRSKLDAELILFNKAADASINIIINRFGIIYGNLENQSNCAVDYIIKCFKNNTPAILKDPLAGRCFISVEDIAEALFINCNSNDASLNMNKISIYNIQGPHLYQLSKIEEFLYSRDLDITNANLSNKNADIKIVKSDFKSLVKRNPKCLSKYINAIKDN